MTTISRLSRVFGSSHPEYGVKMSNYKVRWARLELKLSPGIDLEPNSAQIDEQIATDLHAS